MDRLHTYTRANTHARTHTHAHTHTHTHTDQYMYILQTQYNKLLPAIHVGIQRFIRLFLRLGLGGIVAVGVTVVGALMLLIIVACCVKCIKQNKVSDVIFIRPNHLDIGNGTCYSNDVATEAGSNIGDWKSTNINNFAGRTVDKSECALHNF